MGSSVSDSVGTWDHPYQTQSAHGIIHIRLSRHMGSSVSDSVGTWDHPYRTQPAHGITHIGLSRHMGLGVEQARLKTGLERDRVEKELEHAVNPFQKRYIRLPGGQ
jgi:hypothetical protein